MMNDSENPELDNEMANLTDALLAGRSITPSESAQSLDAVVRGLQQLSTPAQPSAEFRSRLTQRLSTEFEAQARTRRIPTLASFSRRYRSALTAVALLVLISVAVLVGNRIGVLTGTAQGAESAATVAVLSIFGAVLVVAGVYFWWRERK